jgi:hypothetical protein
MYFPFQPSVTVLSLRSKYTPQRYATWQAQSTLTSQSHRTIKEITLWTKRWDTIIKFNIFNVSIHGSVHLNNILLHKSEQDAHVTELILSDNCSTCFVCCYHASSGAQTTVTTASGNRYTVVDKVKFTDKKSTLYIRLKLQLLLIMYILRKMQYAL